MTLIQQHALCKKFNYMYIIDFLVMRMLLNQGHSKYLSDQIMDFYGSKLHCWIYILNLAIIHIIL